MSRINDLYHPHPIHMKKTKTNTKQKTKNICVKAYSKNRHFRVFIMIKIGQTHVFLKDYVHIHQIGSHFVGGYRLDFSPTGQESRRSFCKLLALGSPRLLLKKQNKKLPNLSVLDKKCFFYRDLLRKASDRHIHHKK